MANGTHTWFGGPAGTIPRKVAGPTPMTVKLVPFRLICCPTILGSALNSRVQNVWFNTTTAYLSSTASSSGEKKRPNAGRNPSIGKKLAETALPRIGCGDMFAAEKDIGEDE